MIGKKRDTIAYDGRKSLWQCFTEQDLRSSISSVTSKVCCKLRRGSALPRSRYLAHSPSLRRGLYCFQLPPAFFYLVKLLAIVVSKTEKYTLTIVVCLFFMNIYRVFKCHITEDVGADLNEGYDTYTFPKKPNTDEFFLSEFLKKMMGLASSQGYNFSAYVCSWRGVSCDADREHVVDLVFSGMDLSATIPDNTIGKLGKLQFLDLSHNKITDLPLDFWSLSTVKSLNLFSNQISGSLTNNIGNFGLLESIDLSSNNFSEEIPEAVSSLLSLRVLKLDQNRFAHNIPSGILKCQSMICATSYFN
ncbi:putative LRR receptor-like serine/threonine-protein kinase [Glycine max]|nr:putative LRR receptor-like serine/threonine-protein kinase [Glycine max]